ncbi:hypothetical protein [Paraherbaspirillum soli]|uniref:DUF4124 domain-containing protein n=1 Tax=Paraherbaspirillum soli TaxID=631222 RepID=A0ABW0MFP6_9BURK
MLRKTINLVFCIGLSTTIVGGLVWVMQKSMSPIKVSVEPTPEQSKPKMISEGAQEFAPPQVVESNIPGQIFKCHSGGKITYSDKKCTQAATVVTIHESSGGFVSPDRTVIADARARIRADIQREGSVAATNQGQGATNSNNQYECNYLSQRVKDIDESSRMAQSGQSQQALRLNRQDARDRQFRLGC